MSFGKIQELFVVYSYIEINHVLVAAMYGGLAPEFTMGLASVLIKIYWYTHLHSPGLHAQLSPQLQVELPQVSLTMVVVACTMR